MESPTLERHAPSFREALAYWARLGWVNFGGPAGQIALLHRDLVERRRWIAEDRFLHALDVCMLLPGPEAQQLATYLGWHLHGVRGGVAAGALFVLPSVAVLLVLSWLYLAWGEVPAVAAILNGIQPVVLAIVAAAMVRIGRRALRAPLHVALALAALLGIAVLGVPFPAIVAGAALLGGVAARWMPRAPTAAPTLGGATAQDPTAGRRAGRRVLVLTAAGFALWLAPAAALVAARGTWRFHLDLYLFFTKAAFVTFGGAYAVLAYVAQMATESGWLTRESMVDGLALAETTPGPLIIVLQFVGFVAGWTHAGPHPALQSAILAALVTSWATFLPSTLLGLLVGPYVERLERLRWARAALAAVTAAVVGVIASLGLILGLAILFPAAAAGGLDVFNLTVALVALVALARWKLEPHWAIAAGAGLGLVRLALRGFAA